MNERVLFNILCVLESFFTVSVVGWWLSISMIFIFVNSEAILELPIVLQCLFLLGMIVIALKLTSIRWIPFDYYPKDLKRGLKSGKKEIS